MYTSADTAERNAIARGNASSSVSTTSESTGGSSTPSNGAVRAVASGDVQQVQTYLAQYPEEAEQVYAELLREDPDLYYRMGQWPNGQTPQVILAQHKLDPAFPAQNAGNPSEPDLSAEMAEIRREATSYEQVMTSFDVVDRIEAQYGSAVAADFIADYIRSDPNGFAAAYTELSRFSVSPTNKQVYADALSQVYDGTPTLPYGQASPQQFASGLANGVADYGSYPGAVAELVGLSGNDKLQVDFVTAGLHRARLEMVSNPQPHNRQDIESYVGSLGYATVGSREAARAVIRFAESYGMGYDDGALDNAGVESLRWILERFHGADAFAADDETRRSFINFYEAAVNGSGAELSIRESAELFFAITGASTEGTGLLEADGAGGKSNPRATELTAQLFMDNYDRWIASPELRLHSEGQMNENGLDGPLEGVDINGSFKTFFNEALLDPNEAGDYQQNLFAFVMGKAFEAMNPDSNFADAAGGPDAAALLAGNLVGQINGAEVDARQAFGEEAAASERRQERIWAMLTVVSVAGGGAGLAARPGLSAGAKIVIGALVETGKSGGRIAAEELISQGVDEKTANMVANYINDGELATDAFEGSSLFSELEAVGMDEEKLRGLEGWIQSSIGDEDFTLGKMIASAIPVITSDLPPEISDRLDTFKDYFNDGLSRQ